MTSPPSKPTPTLTVTGQGRARVPPDRIVFTLELDALTPTVDDTQRALEALRQRLSAALAATDVDADRVSSAGPQLTPQHDYEKSLWVFKGIRGSERITVRIPHEHGRATQVLRALGGELEHVRVTVGHINRDANAGRADALRAAVADARVQAEIIAAASGVCLGPIAEILRDTDSNRCSLDEATHTVFESASSNGGEFDPTEITIETEVRVVWTLAPAA